DRIVGCRLGHLPSVNHISAVFAHAESIRHQPESDHPVTSRGAAAGPDRSSTGHEAGTIVIAHRVGTIARAGKRNAADKQKTWGTSTISSTAGTNGGEKQSV